MLRLAALLVLLAAPAPAQGLDAVGRIGQHQDGLHEGCSGVLVAPDLVLTARHCTGRIRPGSHRFFIGWGKDGSDQTLPVASILRAPDLSHAPDFTNDVALLTLSAPADAVTPLPLSPAPAVGTQVRVVSYPRRNDYARLNRTCTLLQRDITRMLLDCPARGGMSGAPVLVRRGGGWAVAGVLVARAGDDRSLALRIDTVQLNGLPPIR